MSTVRDQKHKAHTFNSTLWKGILPTLLAWYWFTLQFCISLPTPSPKSPSCRRSMQITLIRLSKTWKTDTLPLFRQKNKWRMAETGICRKKNPIETKSRYPSPRISFMNCNGKMLQKSTCDGKCGPCNKAQVYLLHPSNKMQWLRGQHWHVWFK